MEDEHDKTSIAPEVLMTLGTDAMSKANWAEAVRFFEQARDSIIIELRKSPSYSDSTQNHLSQLLSILEGAGEPGRPGRLAMAKDYRERVAGLKNWMTDVRIPQEDPKNKRRTSFQKARYELSLSPLSDDLKGKAQEAIRDITGDNSQDDEFFKISEVVFAFIVDQFLEYDPNNEEERVDFALGLNHDSTYEKERRASRSDNPLAVQNRIIDRYQKILKTNFAQYIIATHQTTFIKLSSTVQDSMAYFS